MNIQIMSISMMQLYMYIYVQSMFLPLIYHLLLYSDLSIDSRYQHYAFNTGNKVSD